MSHAPHTTAHTGRPAAVHATLNYFVAPPGKPYSYTFDPPPGMPQTNVEYRAQPVVIHDLRPIAHELSLDVQGFQWTVHPTAQLDFHDAAELQRVYYPESQALLKSATGGSRVIVFDHTLRVRVPGVEDRASGQPRQPVPRVHNDYTRRSGPQRLRDLLPDEAEQLLRQRFAIVNLWRPIRGPLQDSPLAICDARTLHADDLVPLDLIYRDRVGETYLVHHSPRHRWYYAPEMSSDEVLFIKTYDSAEDGRARFVAHGAFEDPHAPPNPVPRASIELRALIFY